MNIELNKKYITRNGEVVRVVCVDYDNFEHPVICLHEDGSVLHYRFDGEFIFGYGSENDLISEYYEVPEIDLDYCPKWMNYAFMDSDGMISMSDAAPSLVQYDGDNSIVRWYYETDHHTLIPEEYIIKPFTMDWKDSIHRIDWENKCLVKE